MWKHEHCTRCLGMDSGSETDTGLVEFSQTPIDQEHLVGELVDEDVLGLDISVHDALAVTVVESLQMIWKWALHTMRIL